MATKTMYRVFFNSLEEVKISKETEKSVWIGHRRHARRSEFERFFDTREEAKKYLVEKCRKVVDRLQEQLEQAQAALEAAEKL